MNDNQKIEYLKRLYFAVDGLWFMKTEETDGFDKALNIDNEVWKVMPKIQARFFKSIYGLDKGWEALQSCLTEKLLIEDYIFQTEASKQSHSFKITVTKCPWMELLVKSGRANLAREVGSRICNTENSGFAREFGENISFKIERQICGGSNLCILLFTEQ